jgi:probable DNA metabolism protein
MKPHAWTYGGSLEELILLAYRAYAQAAAPDALADPAAMHKQPADNAPKAEADLFTPPEAFLFETEPVYHPVSPEKAASELQAFSCDLYDQIALLWMSEEGLELPLLRGCAKAGRHGSDALLDQSDSDIRAIALCARRVSREIDRFIGIARFSPRSDGLFVAVLESDANIAGALMPHFARRFGTEDFAIVDLKRQLAFAREKGAFICRSGEEALAYLPDSQDAEEDVLLWKRYFKAVEIPSRRNPKLQLGHLPRRYWRFLPEINS